jgi:hypothetical protein
MALVALIAVLAAVGGVVGWSLWQDRNDGRVLVTATLLVAFALLLWAFALLLWDLLEGRMRRWLHGVLVAVLAPACALAAAVVSAMAGLALVTALEPEQAPVGPSEPRVHVERAQPKTTSEKGTSPETTSGRTASPSAAPASSPSASPSAASSATPSPSASPSP